jgi:hypothetical protein
MRSHLAAGKPGFVHMVGARVQETTRSTQGLMGPKLRTAHCQFACILLAEQTTGQPDVTGKDSNTTS